MVEQTKTIQSVDRALSILELFSSSSTELSVTEISNELQLNKSTVFGLIRTLLSRGYLCQNDDNAKYSLGLKLFELGYNVQLYNVLRQTLRPYLEIIVAEFNEAVHLAIEDKGQIVYVDRLESGKVVSLKYRIGTREPMYCTGLGKCLLAFMDENKSEKIMGQIKFEPRTKNTITNIDELRREVKIIRNRGYSIDNEEYEIGLMCVSVPVISKEKGIIAAISISGPTSRIDYDRTEFVANFMLGVVKQIGNL